MTKRFLLASSIVLLGTTPARAQAPTNYTLRLYNQGAAAPLSTTDLQAATVLCGQAPILGTNVNPNKVVFNDPAGGTNICIWTDPGTGALFSVPFGGSYEGTLTATNIAGTTAESTPRAPFTRPGLPPAVPTGVQFKR